MQGNTWSLLVLKVCNWFICQLKIWLWIVQVSNSIRVIYFQYIYVFWSHSIPLKPTLTWRNSFTETLTRQVMYSPQWQTGQQRVQIQSDTTLKLPPRKYPHSPCVCVCVYVDRKNAVMGMFPLAKVRYKWAQSYSQSTLWGKQRFATLFGSVYSRARH